MTKIPPRLATAPHPQSNWDWRAAGNFIGGGSGSGVLALGAVAAPAGLPVVAAALMGGAMIALGLTCVWLEIGKPWRAVNVFFHPQTSWMTREGIVALLVYGLGGGAAILQSAGLLGLAGLAAMGFVYCQGRILTAAKGIPAWREPLVVPLILATAATEGAGLVLVPAAILGGGAWLGQILLGLLAVRYGVWRGYMGRLGAGRAPAGAVAAARRLNPPLVLAGHLLPAGLVVAGLAPDGLVVAGPDWLAALAGLLAAAAGWRLKYVLVTRMALTQGFALPVTPVRGRGTAGPGVRPGWGTAP